VHLQSCVLSLMGAVVPMETRLTAYDGQRSILHRCGTDRPADQPFAKDPFLSGLDVKPTMHESRGR
jgi:hypothetical protein